MTKINELAEYYGVHPGHIEASINDDNQLEFGPPPADLDQDQRREELRRAIGAEQDCTDIGSAIELMDRIAGALRKARSRSIARG